MRSGGDDRSRSDAGFILLWFWSSVAWRISPLIRTFSDPTRWLLVAGAQVRFNTKTRSVEMRTSKHTLDSGALQKGADFVSAFMLGFEVQDAVALLRLDDLYIESFQVTDVKMLRGDHLSRAIGRIAGQDGKTRYAIENATRTRIVVADQRIHLLGSYANLRVARNAICDLILGAPPGKVYNNMRNVAKRMSERY